jgi:hypothetical protein
VGSQTYYTMSIRYWAINARLPEVVVHRCGQQDRLVHGDISASYGLGKSPVPVPELAKPPRTNLRCVIDVRLWQEPGEQVVNTRRRLPGDRNQR